MRTGQEFEEDGRVDRQIAIETPWHETRSASRCAFDPRPKPSDSPANTDTPQGVEYADGGKVWRSGSDETENSSDTEGTVKGPFSSNNVASET